MLLPFLLMILIWMADSISLIPQRIPRIVLSVVAVSILCLPSLLHHDNDDGVNSHLAGHEYFADMASVNSYSDSVQHAEDPHTEEREGAKTQDRLDALPEGHG